VSYFTFTYSGTLLGTLEFSTYVQGTDQNTNSQIQSNWQKSNQVRVRFEPVLNASFNSLPATMNTGQRITVVMS